MSKGRAYGGDARSLADRHMGSVSRLEAGGRCMGWQPVWKLDKPEGEGGKGGKGGRHQISFLRRQKSPM